MRITREALLKVVRDTVAQRTRSDRSLISIYLCGSLLGEDYLLGGAADIDLVIIHSDWEGGKREIVRITDDVHLDIAHHLHKDYRQTRRLRLHPWLGPTLASCSILYDPQHFMDFTQASVRGQFDRSDFVIQRARSQAEHARQIWQGYHEKKVKEPGPDEISDYLRAIDHAVNAVAILSGSPLTERRLLLDFPARAESVRRPGLQAGLLGLLGAPRMDGEALRAWLPAWQDAYEAIPPGEGPARLHPIRRSYYENAIRSMLDRGQPEAALWPLLRTWTHAVAALPEDAPAREGWEAALGRLGLIKDGFDERIRALDAYLDLVEETLDTWAQQNGVELQ